MKNLNQQTPVKLTEVTLSSSSGTLTQAMVSNPNTIYIVKDIFYLTGTIEIGNNSILDFRGGSLSGGCLKGNFTDIKAPTYQIFYGVELIETFTNSVFSAHWFGAKGDGVTDDSPSINYALENSGTIPIEMGSLDYLIESSININKINQKLTCYGSIVTNKDITLINISAHHAQLNINKLSYNTTDVDYTKFKGTGIVFSDNSYHSTISVNHILKLRKGISFEPVAKTLNFAGIQYSKISFQEIYAFYCIYINLLSGKEKGKNLWTNENQFNGGRVSGNYGIYVERPSYNDPQFDYINGNVFNCIGFEDINIPIYLYHASFNTFRDLRMSESIHSENAFIDLKNCQSMIFDIKSHIPYNRIKAENCIQIELSRSYTDDGHGFEYDKMYINQDPMIPTSEDIKFIFKSYSSVNTLKKLYYDINHTPENPINYNEFFVYRYDGMMTFSNFCEITIYNNLELIVDFENSIYKMHPDMTLRYNHHGIAKIKFMLGNTPITTINQRGTYKITYDRDNNISIIPLAIDIKQD